MPEKRKRVPTVVPGAVPGDLVENSAARDTTVRCLAYSPDRLIDEAVTDPKRIRELIDEDLVTWLDVDGLGDTQLLKQVAEAIDLHPLALEDIVQLEQRPKVDQYDDIKFVVVRMVSYDGALGSEQLSMVLGKGFVVTFQGERPGDSLDPVRSRIREHRGRIREAAPDYLLYALLDAVIDQYFPVLDRYGDSLDALEEEALTEPSRDTPEHIRNAKRELQTLRHAIGPIRDTVSQLERDTSGMISSETKVYLRDCLDHTKQLGDVIDTYRETAAGLLDIYLSSLSNRMNDVMKVLTIIATLFIPLTFVTGVYGMNFDPKVSAYNMPELGMRYGYPVAMGIMFTVASVLIVYFVRKGWLGPDD